MTIWHGRTGHSPNMTCDQCTPPNVAEMEGWSSGETSEVWWTRTALVPNFTILAPDLRPALDAIRALIPCEATQDISLMDAWAIFADIRAVLDRHS